MATPLSNLLDWLLAGVRPHVDLEAVLVHVAVAADGALELGAGVRLHVPLQPRRARSRPLTDVAFVPASYEECKMLHLKLGPNIDPITDVNV